jgi:hypothetical protein
VFEYTCGRKDEAFLTARTDTTAWMYSCTQGTDTALLWIGAAVALSLAAGILVGRYGIGDDDSDPVSVGDET